jgi:hypothetical protein
MGAQLRISINILGNFDAHYPFSEKYHSFFFGAGRVLFDSDSFLRFTLAMRAGRVRPTLFDYAILTTDGAMWSSMTRNNFSVLFIVHRRQKSLTVRRIDAIRLPMPTGSIARNLRM